MTTARVLLVEDHVETRRVLRAALETIPVALDIVDVPSGEEALLEIGRRPVDLMIVDIRLPGMNGFDLVERARRRNPALNYILITGVADEAIRRRVEQSAGGAHFFKPIPMEAFLQAVGRLLPGEVTGLSSEGKSGEALLSAVEARPVKIVQGLRQRLGASAAWLLDGQGHLLAAERDPAWSDELPEALRLWLIALAKEAPSEEPLLLLLAERRMLACLGKRYSVVWGFLPQVWERLPLGTISRMTQEVGQVLICEEVAPPRPVVEQDNPTSPENEGVQNSEATLNGLEALLNRIETVAEEKSEADAFWEAALHAYLSESRDETTWPAAEEEDGAAGLASAQD